MLDRIKKLLELGKSDNPNEAASAVEQAQKLMLEHNITELMLETQQGDESSELIEDETLFISEARRIPRWHNWLAQVLAEVNQCKAYQCRNEFRVVGRPYDAEVARYMFAYLTREIERLCKHHSELRGNPGVAWRTDFCHGAVWTIKRRLLAAAREARAELRRQAYASDTLGNGAAIVRFDSALKRLDERDHNVKRWIERNLRLRVKRASPRRINHDGRATGRRVGKDIDLSRGGRGGLESGDSRRRLPK